MNADTPIATATTLVITNSVSACPVTGAAIVDETGPTNAKANLIAVVPSYSELRLFTIH